ncbi:amidohydrolase family protein [uncultured Amnibacterium sp.]|uniref:amidohydrolase family protein n=1 Tax=uncultured Amnibacterium sp. TaxID=1631851 RepID=UPI0035C973D7
MTNDPHSALRRPALRSEVDLLQHATLADGSVVDLRLAGGTLAAVAPSGTMIPTDADTVLDLDGYVLTAAGADPHAHLDKALTFDEIRPPLGDLERAIESFHGYAAQADADSIAERARLVLVRMLANGTTAVRSHANFFPATDANADPLRGVRALAGIRDEFAGLLDLEIVALPGDDAPDALIEQSLDAGADLIGGAPHLAEDPVAETHRLLDIAERRGVGVDLHADEALTGGLTLAVYAERVRDWPVSKSAGHCVRLGTLPPAELGPVIAAVRAAGIGIISLPITNLYLQGWEQPVSTPRGLTALRALIDAGVLVAAGGDNVRDPFNPVGRADALETASLLVTAGHLNFEEAIAAVTTDARAVMHLPPAGPVVGATADLLAVRAGSVGEAIAFASPDRIVLHEGRLVAQSHLETHVAVPDPGAALQYSRGRAIA